jgi:hypothetical protein
MIRYLTITFALLAAALCALLTAACTSARFAAPPTATTVAPSPMKPAPLGGPYTREREDREFGR